VAAFLLLPVQQCARLAHEARQGFRSLALGARAEVVAEAHPVQFQAVEVVAPGQFPDQPHVVLLDLPVPIVEGPVRPRRQPVRHPPELWIGAPELPVDVAAFIVHVVDIVHAHRNPRRDPLLPRARNPPLVGVDPVLVELPRGVDPAPRHLAAGFGRAREQRLIVGTLWVIPAPHRIPHSAAEAGSLRIGAQHQLAHLGAGVLVDPRVHIRLGEAFAGAREVEVAIVLVQGNTPCGGESGGSGRQRGHAGGERLPSGQCREAHASHYTGCNGSTRVATQFHAGSRSRVLDR